MKREVPPVRPDRHPLAASDSVPAKIPGDRPVVVGFDGSPESSAALRWASKQAVEMSAPVEVVHCYRPGSLTDLGFGSPRESAAASAVVVADAVSAALEEMPVVPEVIRSSVAGSPAEVLVERTGSAALLVLGVHRQTELGDLILGRVGRECLRRARCPVVVVGLDQSAVRHEAPAADRAGTL